MGIIPTLLHSLYKAPTYWNSQSAKYLKTSRSKQRQTIPVNSTMVKLLGTRTPPLDPRSSKLENFEYRVSRRFVRVSRQEKQRAHLLNCCSLPFRCLFLNVAIKFLECFETQNSARLRRLDSQHLLKTWMMKYEDTCRQLTLMLH